MAEPQAAAAPRPVTTNAAAKAATKTTPKTTAQTTAKAPPKTTPKTALKTTLKTGPRAGARSASRSAQARAELTGAASLALRPVLEGSRRPARVLAVFPLGAYLETRGPNEPRVVSLVTGEGTRLPNAIVLAEPLPPLAVGDEAAVGDGVVEAGRAVVRIRRWWDPTPALGLTEIPRLERAAVRLAELSTASGRATGLDEGGFPAQLAAACANDSLLGALTAAEQLMGLGPGLTPSGDDMLAGLLTALRHLGTAAGVERAVWLADWLAATVVFDAPTRTTPISATLLHCAAKGQCCAEAAAVLRGIVGLQSLDAAVQRLLRLGHTSGADLTWGIRAGLSAVLALARKDAGRVEEIAQVR